MMLMDDLLANVSARSSATVTPRNALIPYPSRFGPFGTFRTLIRGSVAVIHRRAILWLVVLAREMDYPLMHGQRPCPCSIPAYSLRISPNRNRNVKPDNVLLAEQGHAHLTEFTITDHCSDHRMLTGVTGSVLAHIRLQKSSSRKATRPRSTVSRLGSACTSSPSAEDPSEDVRTGTRLTASPRVPYSFPKMLR